MHVTSYLSILFKVTTEQYKKSCFHAKWFPVCRLERPIITSIKRVVKYLLACTVFNEFTNKGKFVTGLEFLKMRSILAFLSEGRISFFGFVVSVVKCCIKVDPYCFVYGFFFGGSCLGEVHLWLIWLCPMMAMESGFVICQCVCVSVGCGTGHSFCCRNVHAFICYCNC